MKIIILGAGTVGSTLAISLSKEDNDITVVDEVPAKLHHLEEEAEALRIVLCRALSVFGCRREALPPICFLPPAAPEDR